MTAAKFEDTAQRTAPQALELETKRDESTTNLPFSTESGTILMYLILFDQYYKSNHT